MQHLPKVRYRPSASYLATVEVSTFYLVCRGARLPVSFSASKQSPRWLTGRASGAAFGAGGLRLPISTVLKARRPGRDARSGLNTLNS